MEGGGGGGGGGCGGRGFVVCCTYQRTKLRATMPVENTPLCDCELGDFVPACQVKVIAGESGRLFCLFTIRRVTPFQHYSFSRFGRPTEAVQPWYIPC